MFMHIMVYCKSNKQQLFAYEELCVNAIYFHWKTFFFSLFILENKIIYVYFDVSIHLSFSLENALYELLHFFLCII